MSEGRNKIVGIAVSILIAAGIAATIIRTRHPERKESGYRYTAYAVDEDGKAYELLVNGPGLKWPVHYKGKTLTKLYGCEECRRTFPAQGMVTACPYCGSSSVGGYNTEIHEPLDIEKIKIEQPDRAED
jgi:hypothetical protein